MSKRDSHTRSILKACSWRVLATLTTMVISYCITNSLHFAISIGMIEVVAKMVLYYVHERIWNNVKV